MGHETGETVWSGLAGYGGKVGKRCGEFVDALVSRVHPNYELMVDLAHVSVCVNVVSCRVRLRLAAPLEAFCLQVHLSMSKNHLELPQKGDEIRPS
jgi:hypothetical protein